jgi:very-short-patch-repair endonuclease
MRVRDKSKIAFARKLRGDMSPPEVMVWVHLRRRRDGMAFRRQHPFGPYVLDFYCAQARLAVEIDGEHHYYEDQQRKDAARDAWLASQGIETLRIPGFEILADPEEMANRIWLKAIESVRSRWEPHSSQGRANPR